MQKMSGADLHFASEEMKPLQGKRIAKIRKTAEGIYLFKIGTEELLFEPGVRLHLTRQAHQAAESPDGFVAYLRKNLEGKTATSIEKAEGERIVSITAKSHQRLVFELFRKGNIIFVLEDGTIAACLNREEAGGRKIAKGERYGHPKATGFALRLPEKASFGVKLNEKGEPVSYSLQAAGGDRLFPSFSEAADFYYANQLEESEAERAASEKAERLKARLAGQEAALGKLALQKGEAKLAGDAIYAEFEKVEALLAEVRGMKKAGKGEAEISEWLAARGARLLGAEVEIELGA